MTAFVPVYAMPEKFLRQYTAGNIDVRALCEPPVSITHPYINRTAVEYDTDKVMSCRQPYGRLFATGGAADVEHYTRIAIGDTVVGEVMFDNNGEIYQIWRTRLVREIPYENRVFKPLPLSHEGNTLSFGATGLYFKDIYLVNQYFATGFFRRTLEPDLDDLNCLAHFVSPTHVLFMLLDIRAYTTHIVYAQLSVRHVRVIFKTVMDTDRFRQCWITDHVLHLLVTGDDEYDREIIVSNGYSDIIGHKKNTHVIRFNLDRYHSIYHRPAPLAFEP